MPEATKQKETVFRSPDPGLRLVRRPARNRYNERGELEVLEGERYEFKNGELRVSDPDAIEWLRKHERFNVKFVELGNEPGRESPTVTEAMTEIATAAARGDAGAIAAAYEREVESYDRAPVKEAAQKALEALESAIQEGAQGEDAEVTDTED